MDFRFGGELPDDHVFFSRIRPLVEGVFKLISWLIITATLGVAAELTMNNWLWAMYYLCFGLLFLFVQSFFNWLFLMKFPARASRRTPSAQPKGIWRRIAALKTIAVAALAFVVWSGFQVATQKAIGYAVAAIADFQKAGAKPAPPRILRDG